MTFEQLVIFIAVAEREHLTNAASAIGLTPSAVSASIRALEASYNVRLFERVGRRIELTQAGRLFLVEARATVARARAAELALSELGELKRGVLDIHASQTVASYWLPQFLMQFHEAYPLVEIRLAVGNTQTVARAVAEGLAELGFVEGTVALPELSVMPVARDELVAVVAADHTLAREAAPTLPQLVEQATWVMRERGSGTRSEFETALRDNGCDPAALNIALELPSNEAVISAVLSGRAIAALSSFAVAPFVRSGMLKVLDIELRKRSFVVLRHKERTRSQAAGMLLAFCTRQSEH